VNSGGRASAHPRWQAGLAELETLAREMGHRLRTGLPTDHAVLRTLDGPGAACALALPQGLHLYCADVEMPAQQALDADYTSDFVVSLCIEGDVEGEMPGGVRFCQHVGRLGAFHSPGGGSWRFRTGAAPTRWRSVAVEVPHTAWPLVLPGHDPASLHPGAAVVGAEPWLLALATATCRAALRRNAGDLRKPSAADRLQQQALAMALWQAGLRALQPATSAHVLRLQGARDQQLAVQARRAVDDDLAAAWTLRALGEHLGVPARRLGSVFRGAYGLGLDEYVQQQRLERARRLIEGGASVTQAGFEVGYDHAASFSRAYRRAFGHAPRQTLR
jgi:AraC-like DNA-binding protein